MIEGYPVSVQIDVRWRDVDALGHVNNAVYFTYLEVARTHYFERAFNARAIDDIKFMLASIRCDFLSPAYYGDTVEVGIRILSVGRTSFDFDYEVRAIQDDKAIARALSTQVLYDHAAGQKLPITEDWLDRVAAVEGQRPRRKEAGSRF